MVDRLTAYVRRGNRNVIGWLTAGAVKMICRIGHAQIEAGVQGHIAEIGVHHGRLFILLALLARPQERSIAIDLFGQQHLNPERSGHGDLPALMKNCSRYYTWRDIGGELNRDWREVRTTWRNRRQWDENKVLSLQHMG